MLVMRSLGSAVAVAATLLIVGPAWEISDNFSVDTGGRVGLTDTAPDWSVLAGINYTFGGFPPEEKREK